MQPQTENLKKFCLKAGAHLAKIADLKEYVCSFGEEQIIKPFSYALSIAVKLCDEIIEEIEDCPTSAYADHYREINKTLDHIAEKVSGYIKEMGYNSVVIPASKVVDEKNLCGHVSHKAIARLAGVGWQGKSLLIVNPSIGPRFRLVTVLTDMPLIPDKPLKNCCRGCILCTRHCPAQAIKNVKTENYYGERDDAVDLQKCYEKLLEFKSREGIGATVCGVCIKVCPYGRKKVKS